MRVFVIFELVVILILLYLILNLLRYFFFKSAQGPWFGLSNTWIRQEQEGKKNGKGGS